MVVACVAAWLACNLAPQPCILLAGMVWEPGPVPDDQASHGGNGKTSFRLQIST